MSQISLLLGAGFSVNRGYPTAVELNTKITELKPTDFTISTSGAFAWLHGKPDPFKKSTSYYGSKLFVLEYIAFYCRQNTFDYEQFYDDLQAKLKGESVEEEFGYFCNAFKEIHNIQRDIGDILFEANKIFNQIISALIKDRDGNKYYDTVSHGHPNWRNYSGFTRCLEAWSASDIIHVHTLNHDLFFETLKSSDILKGELDDGFTELGSPFYGELDGSKVRLRYFTNSFQSKFRLYKLHGSLDQYPFHSQNGAVEYIKIRYGVSLEDLYKEVLNDKDELSYDNDFTNYHSDFLSGTTSKILRYREPAYYEPIFQHFEQNLRDSTVLIIIGYGCGDSEINDLIDKHFPKNREVYIVDPFPGDKSQNLRIKLNATLITKDPDNLSIEDFQ